MSNSKFYVLVAGSRSFADYDLMVAKLDAFLSRQIVDHRSICVVSGGAKGADKLAERYARMRGFELRVFPADWNQFGKSAGYRRNRQMHEFIAQFEHRGCVCFWDGESRGTAHNFKLAEQFKTPLRVVRFEAGSKEPTRIDSSKHLYQVRWDFLNEKGEWKVDTLTNNGKGFTLEDAKNVKHQLANDEVCIKKNLAIVPLHVHHTLEKMRDNGDIDRIYFESTQNAGEISIHNEIVIMNYDCNGGVEYIKKEPRLASFNGAKWHYARMLSIGFKPSPMDENWLEASK